MRRATLAVILTGAIGLASPASACLDGSVLRRVLREANEDLRACAIHHDLPVGRYAVRATIDAASGKVETFEVMRTPGAIGAAAESCIAAAFTRLAFPALGAVPRRAPATRTVRGRAARVPPPRLEIPRMDRVRVVWPFVLTPRARAGPTAGRRSRRSASPTRGSARGCGRARRSSSS